MSSGTAWYEVITYETSLTTSVQPPRDLSASYVDSSSIRVSFTTGSNDYNSSLVYWVYDASYNNKVYGSGSPLTLTNLSGGTTYYIYANVVIDGIYKATSSLISATTSATTALPSFWFKFLSSDVNGSSIYDYGSLSYKGTMGTGVSVVTTDSTYPSGVLSLPASSSSSFTFSTSITVSSSNGFTVTLKFKINKGRQSDLYEIFVFGNSTNGIMFYILEYQLYLIIYISGVSSNYTFYISSLTAWNTVMIRWLASPSNSIDVFVNGTFTYNVLTSKTVPSFSISSVKLGGTNAVNWGGTQLTSTGYIKDYRFYNYAITDTVMSSIYSSS